MIRINSINNSLICHKLFLSNHLYHPEPNLDHSPGSCNTWKSLFWISWMFIPLFFLTWTRLDLGTIHSRCEFKGDPALSFDSNLPPRMTIRIHCFRNGVSSFAIIPAELRLRAFSEYGDPTHRLALGSFLIFSSAFAGLIWNSEPSKVFQSSLLRSNCLAGIPRACSGLFGHTNSNGCFSSLASSANKGINLGLGSDYQVA